MFCAGRSSIAFVQGWEPSFLEPKNPFACFLADSVRGGGGGGAGRSPPVFVAGLALFSVLAFDLVYSFLGGTPAGNRPFFAPFGAVPGFP